MYKIDKEYNLIDYLKSVGISKNKVKTYVKLGFITINNKTITKLPYQLKKDDILEIKKHPIINTNLNIIYEDNNYLIIDKEPGLLTISTSNINKDKEDTLYKRVRLYLNKKGEYAFIVNRIDKETSGLVVFVKNQDLKDKLQDNWNNVVKKRGYIAIVDGKLYGNGTFRSFLMEDKRQFVYSSRTGMGKEAITHYEVLKNNNNYSMLQVFIDTGRRNQIRVHLSEYGFPIVGDKKYRCKTNPVKRLCLHANILEFIHPVSKKIVSIKCDVPNEFKKLVK